MKNRPKKVMRASKKNPNRPKADDPRQHLQSKASTKHDVREAGEHAQPNHGRQHGLWCPDSPRLLWFLVTFCFFQAIFWFFLLFCLLKEDEYEWKRKQIPQHSTLKLTETPLERLEEGERRSSESNGISAKIEGSSPRHLNKLLNSAFFQFFCCQIQLKVFSLLNLSMCEQFS